MDNKRKLNAKFHNENVYSNFGHVIKVLNINGFRGIDNLTINFEYPITVISGTNGSGKSTIAQLAICGYKKISTITQKRYYIKDFFPVSSIDPTPFIENANIIFKYATDRPNIFQEVTVTRRASDWSGYKRQPERACFYVGFTIYLPKVERRDLSIYNGSQITPGERREISPEAKAHVCNILREPYDFIAFQKVSHNEKEAELGVVTRYGNSYSENNMGFGEGRLLYMVDLLETSPAQSLFVFEEPETSLHESAQYRFTEYLIDVCNRRHHQMIITTHSSVILEALPAEARKFIIRNATGVNIFDRISSSRAKSFLTEGHQRALNICVEDDFAKTLLMEIIREDDPALLKAVSIHAIGDNVAVLNAVRLLNQMNVRVIGIRDGDSSSIPDEAIYTLPGTQAPEKEVYLNEMVQKKIGEEFTIDIPTILAGKPSLDHHDFGKVFAEYAETDVIILNNRAQKEYIFDKGKDYFGALVRQIKIHV